MHFQPSVFASSIYIMCLHCRCLPLREWLLCRDYQSSH